MAFTSPKNDPSRNPIQAQSSRHFNLGCLLAAGLAGLGVLGIVALLAAGGYVYLARSGPPVPTVIPTSTDLLPENAHPTPLPFPTPPVLPTLTPALSLQTPALPPLPSATVTPLLPASTPASATEAAPVALTKVTALMLTASEIPAGWRLDSPVPRLSNGEYAQGQENTAEYLKNLTTWGRLPGLSVRMTPPGDPCTNKNLPILIESGVDLFKNEDSAAQFFRYDMPGPAQNLGVGSLAYFSTLSIDSNYLSGCPSRTTRSLLWFQRANVYASIRLVALTGSMNNADARAQVLAWGKILDGKIIAVSK